MLDLYLEFKHEIKFLHGSFLLAQQQGKIRTSHLLSVNYENFQLKKNHLDNLANQYNNLVD